MRRSAICYPANFNCFQSSSDYDTKLEWAYTILHIYNIIIITPLGLNIYCAIYSPEHTTNIVMSVMFSALGGSNGVYKVKCIC